MLKLGEFFAPLGIVNFSILLIFIACCEIIGFGFTKVFIKKIPEFLRGAVWLLGLGLVIFLYFLFHFFISFAFPTIVICLVILLIPSIAIYRKQKGWQTFLQFWRENYLPLLLLLPVLPLIFIKISLPPYIWDEMAYHYISPYTLYHESAWKLSSGFIENLPRLLETAYIALFSLTKTYAVARLLHLSIFITALLTVYKFLKDEFGQMPALLSFVLLVYHGENLLFRATSGYIDVGTTSLVTIGLVCLVSFFLKNKIGVLIAGMAFWGMAVGSKYSALIPLSSYLLIILALIIKRKLLKKSDLRKYLIAFCLFFIMGGYWYIKNIIHTGNPIYPFLSSFFGCRFSSCPSLRFSDWTLPFSLANAQKIFLAIFAENKRLEQLFFISIFLSMIHSGDKVRKVLTLLASFVFIELLLNAKITGYEPRYFYHWQFLTILLIVLPTTSIAKWIKTPKRLLSFFRSFLNFELRIGKRDKVWWLERKPAEIFFRISSLFFSPLWASAFFFSLTESFTYSGFLPGTKLLIFLAALSGISSRAVDVKSWTLKDRLVWSKPLFKLNRIAFLPFLIVGVIINLLESINYHNYIFSKIHVQPQLLIWPIFLSGFLFFIDFSRLGGKRPYDNFLKKKKLSGDQERFEYREIFNFLFTILILLFAIFRVTSFISDFYKEERQADRETEVQYATRKIDIYQWVERLFPKMKEVVFWCEDQEPETNLVALDPGVIWYGYEGLLRVFMTNCNIKHGEIVDLPAEEVVDSLKEERKSFLIVSLNKCKKEIKSTKMRRSEDEVEYLRQVNNDIICNSEEVLPGLYRFSVSD